MGRAGTARSRLGRVSPLLEPHRSRTLIHTTRHRDVVCAVRVSRAEALHAGPCATRGARGKCRLFLRAGSNVDAEGEGEQTAVMTAPDALQGTRIRSLRPWQPLTIAQESTPSIHAPSIMQRVPPLRGQHNVLVAHRAGADPTRSPRLWRHRRTRAGGSIPRRGTGGRSGPPHSH
ncbi:hypothetical protein C8Q77DRAFT_206660 [Trametes polyzona]|nr:hypothetical protein C8Q77DRAFT_206660 [Trametes polyzona]